MRDQTILNQLDALAGCMASDSANLQTAITLIRTRVDALELTLLGSRFGILKLILLQLFSPKRVALMIRDQHNEQIRKMNLARAEAAKARPTIKKAPPIGVIKAV